MDFIKIKGYKSIKDAEISLRPINILIGANGSGKSNFLSFFEFLHHLYEKKMTEYVALNGGENKFLHHGVKVTKRIEAHLSFNNNVNGYAFELVKGDDGFVFEHEDLVHRGNHQDIAFYKTEARIKHNDNFRADYIRNHIQGLKKFHFHDTGKTAPFNNVSHVPNDTYFLYEKGENIAAFLFKIQTENPIVYRRIVKMIQSIAPYFSDFFLQPNTEGYIRLQWQDKYSSTTYGATDLSDGTVRFIALTVLFMQPDLPQTIIIDELELGLHPFALAKLAGMIKSAAAKKAQVIVATQSTDLISHFLPDDVIAVDSQDGASIFNRLKEEDLAIWLNDFALGDLWKRNIITEGQP